MRRLEREELRCDGYETRCMKVESCEDSVDEGLSTIRT